MKKLFIILSLLAMVMFVISPALAANQNGKGHSKDGAGVSGSTGNQGNAKDVGNAGGGKGKGGKGDRGKGHGKGKGRGHDSHGNGKGKGHGKCGKKPDMGNNVDSVSPSIPDSWSQNFGRQYRESNGPNCWDIYLNMPIPCRP